MLQDLNSFQGLQGRVLCRQNAFGKHRVDDAYIFPIAFRENALGSGNISQVLEVHGEQNIAIFHPAFVLGLQQ